MLGLFFTFVLAGILMMYLVWQHAGILTCMHHQLMYNLERLAEIRDLENYIDRKVIFTPNQ